tara:strand:- start:5040 stop:5852 length:813 start_codon:yes stop_codon:yes gene_type:complete
MIKENKLPEVGKRYRHCTNHIPCEVEGITDNGFIFISWVNSPALRDDIFYPNSFCFWEMFEEIPEQEPTAENHVPDARKKVDEVQEAKEELKWQIHNGGWNSLKQDHKRLLHLANNLINALDAQNDVSIKELMSQEQKEEYSVGKKANCKRCNREFRQRHKGDFICSNYCKNTPKKEYVSPVKTESIWKPMSELRGDIFNIYIKWFEDIDIMPAQYSETKNIIFVHTGGKTCQFDCNYHRFKMWCTLTDFNNQVQDNTDRLDKLETKLNK